MTKRDVYQEVTDKIIDAMESGALPWRKTWQGGATSSFPRRITGEHYKGINVLLLWMTANARGYTADQWMTFQQAKKLGASVRKGERGTGIVFFKQITIEDKQTNEEKKVPVARAYTVFNVEQIDGLPEKYYPVQLDMFDSGARPIEELEAFYHSTGATIIKDGSQPRYCYGPGKDQIHMPLVQQFETAHEYYGTLAHELIHWTGHSTRLDRLASQKREHYAFEELIAEIGACFITAERGGIYDETNSAAYLQSWLKALKNDKRMIFKAAAAAQKASDYLIEAAATGRTLIAA